ncbi:MAG: hypothetical protein PHG12_10575, partial [Sphaerochaeta sp.]|nr:hypothetical protein [Sphaerochaeta sp.]
MKTYCKISIFKHGIYDSFIYKKKLYLVTLNKEIIPMDWVDFIDNITPKRNAFPFKVAFTRSDILYSPQYEIFIKDSTIQKDLVESFSELKDFSFNFDDENFKKFVSSKKYWKQLCELPRDIKCANNQFYIMNDNEVLASKMQYGKAISNRSSLSKFHTFIKGSFVSMEFVGRDIFLAAQDDGVY